MEKKIQNVHALLNAVIESIGDGILITDDQNNISLYNNNFIKMFDASEDFLKGNNFDSLMDNIILGLTNDEEIKSKIIDLKDNPCNVFNCLMNFLNGRVYEICSRPHFIDNKLLGRVWSFKLLKERTKTEQAFKKKKELSHMAIKVVNDGVWDWDLKENKVYFNPQYFTMSGYEIDEFPHAYEEWRKRVHPEHIKHCEKGIEDYLSGKTEMFDVEFKFLKKDKTWMWIRGRGKGVEFDENGNLTRFLGTHSDITKRKIVEENLAKERERLKYILEGTNAGTWEWNIQSGEVIFNEKWAQIIGYTLSELEPLSFRTWERFLHPEDIKTSSELLNEHIRGESEIYDCEYRMRHKTGDWIWVQDRGKVSSWNKDGKPLLMQGTHQDISERKQAEYALKENEEKLRTLFSSMTEIVALHELVFDKEGRPVNYRITGVNSAYCRIVGVEEKNVIGKLATEVYGASAPPYLEEYSNVARTGKSHIFETYYPPLKRYLSISAVSPAKNKFATITTDITELKLAQQALKDKNKELEQIVYVASHDLRSPLVNVDGYSRELEYIFKELEEIDKKENLEQLRDKLRDQIPEVKDALFHIRNSTRQMDKLLMGLLKLSRSGRSALNIIEIDMNILLPAIVSSFDFIIKENNIQVSLSEFPSCMGDEVQISQVFSNLIENAIKFLDPSRPGKINIGGRKEMNRSVYWVEDNGIGIDLKHQDSIFELFHRLSPANYPGEGLGLTIARQITGRMNGDISVESEPGKGSCFYIKLPAKN